MKEVTGEEAGKRTVEKSVHSGHRERIKNLFLKNGLDYFEPHTILELLLYYSIPLKDTNPVAHRLLEKFGSFSGVFDAPIEELLKVEGVGKSTAVLIKLVPQLSRKYQEGLDRDKNVIFSYDEAGKFLLKKFIGRPNEVVVLMLLDSKSRVVFCDVVNEGTATAASIYMKKIVRLCVQYNAVYAVLSHNHPSGNCLPSRQDLETTRWVFEAMGTVEVKLLDHIIVSGEDFLSVAKSQLLPELFNRTSDTE